MQLSLLDEDSIEYKESYILISLREDMHEKILMGLKKYEYRRIFVRFPAKVFIYVTGETQSICAIAEFGKPIVGSIEEMVKVNSKEPNPNPTGIRDYFNGKREGFAIPILRYQELNEVTLKQLRQIFGKFYPPQSFVNLENNEKLLNLLLDKTHEKK